MESILGDGAPARYVAEGDAPEGPCLSCGTTTRRNLYEDGIVVEGPLCSMACAAEVADG